MPAASSCPSVRPDEFDEIRTPEWATSPATSAVAGSEVRTGHRSDGDDWRTQSVLVLVDGLTLGAWVGSRLPRGE
ncbi:hypothetical protein [Halomarina oriensis]|uniref:Uncharacterized protein n=1 Tax=Halomarina oriensis TaxID=671145 RepID=A0A6B0GNU5_9EURY|nr:hypothetical protein [Halomarina oriensis]MWG35257.1 hypothetical protein [Halomarina oriensis]